MMYHPTPKTPSSKYKTVVAPQPNERFGSQIYENHHRVWLEPYDTQPASSTTTMNEATLNAQHIPYRDLNMINFEYDEEDDTSVEVVDQQEEMERENDEREYMFEKPLTPSDVGKLNRLVIPKQYAEKYFPLSGDSGDKGLLLTFEDELGKFWRFRYSYWNSSQSYVLTKGWSRFVKEKHLGAGDIVSFERRRFDVQRLYIRWRRGGSMPVQDNGVGQTAISSSAPPSNSNANTTTGSWTRLFYSAHPYPSHHLHGPDYYQPDHCLHAGYAAEKVVAEKPKAKQGNSKRLRLFGVNLDCQLDEPDVSPFSNPVPTQVVYSHGDGSNHKDYNYSTSLNQRGNAGRGSGSDL
ncbi:hypothetical protein C5167_002803 [Papaver somniferum]|uniref:TF-B3 domain-containing protein n=1 Tax=Papaver somniferum TaxID=3469 RepID=A0A4Y7L304_PAPSO|nr:B3 domain-containing protein At2g36080-like [Papaver somniferum]RZC78575.1 hypothetical protein C5167_002803 [Papaver somniferum]